ncbi:hypothetical protein R50073_19870 [Maricurvus nonylphenolicus]|uniref:CbtA family protein n=1 Tax=Maricurvus nonylphenolicus TaxID=1008307 RepID=UPI0036F1E3C2
MIFRSIITNALLLGLVTGIFLSITQQIGVTPIIFAAESFEQSEAETDTSEADVPTTTVVAEAPAQETVSVEQSAHDHSTHDHASHDHGDSHHDATDQAAVAGPAEVQSTVVQEQVDHHDDHGHSHDADAWAPEDGAERTFYTYVSNVLAAIGFAAVLLALMAQVQLQGLAQVSIGRGLLWGGAGFIALFLVPGIGLPPEIPGIEAAVIGSRQNWWLLAVVSAAAGLGVIAFAPKFYKAGGAVLLALPFLIGAPHPAGPAFIHPDPKVVESLTNLHEQFIIASGISNLLFWLLLGAACAWVLNRWPLTNSESDVVRNG